jgi:hypothetical protein
MSQSMRPTLTRLSPHPNPSPSFGVKIFSSSHQPCCCRRCSPLPSLPPSPLFNSTISPHHLFTSTHIFCHTNNTSFLPFLNGKEMNRREAVCFSHLSLTLSWSSLHISLSSLKDGHITPPMCPLLTRGRASLPPFVRFAKRSRYVMLC